MSRFQRTSVWATWRGWSKIQIVIATRLLFVSKLLFLVKMFKRPLILMAREPALGEDSASPGRGAFRPVAPATCTWLSQCPRAVEGKHLPPLLPETGVALSSGRKAASSPRAECPAGSHPTSGLTLDALKPPERLGMVPSGLTPEGLPRSQGGASNRSLFLPPAAP